MLPGTYTVKLYHPAGVVFFQVVVEAKFWPFFNGYFVMIAGGTILAIGAMLADKTYAKVLGQVDARTYRTKRKLLRRIIFFITILVVITLFVRVSAHA